MGEELVFEMEPTRYSYIFDDQITVESVQELINVLSSYNEVDLFITTPGGEASSMNILIHYINKHPDIVVYLNNYIASAGTFLLIDCEKPIVFTEDLEFILFHLGDRPVEGQFRKRTIDDKIMYEQLKEANEVWADKFKKLGLNNKEIKSFLEGNDVILYRKDFNRLKINKK